MSRRICYAHDEGKPYDQVETFIHGYYLDLDNPRDAKTYKAIEGNRRDAGVKLFGAISGGQHKSGNVDKPITLETDYVFDNQWNSDTARVFEWTEEIFPNKRIKSGHYLDITPEMRDLQHNTFKCGYCGKQYYGESNEGKFCGACLDSEYLKESDLRLLRVQRVDDQRKRPALSADELTTIKPDYIKRQTTGTKSRANQARIKSIQYAREKAQKDIRCARMERRGMEWLYKRNISLNNVIFYDHTEVFCFGWHGDGLDFDVAQELRALLVEFPYKWEIKTHGLGKLTSEEN